MEDENKPPPQTSPTAVPETVPEKGITKNPHDAFFKDMLADIDHARLFIKKILPKYISSMFNWAELEPQKDTFITPEGRELRADALFKLPFKMGTQEDYVYLLVEHKSTQPSGINMQLRNYAGQIYNHQIRKQTGPHLVIPLVFYHGKTAWTQARRLVDTCQIPKPYRKRLTAFVSGKDYALFDAVSVSIAKPPAGLSKKLTDSQIVNIYLYVLRNIWRNKADIKEDFSFLADLFTADATMARKIVYYLYRHYDIAEDVVLKVVNHGGKEENMLTYTEMSEQLIEEGMQKGRQEGMQKGRQEGMQKGRQEGMQKGRQEGIQEGVQRGRQEGIEEGVQRGTSEALHNLAQNMLTEGLSIETIVRVTGLSEQEVRGLN